MNHPRTARTLTALALAAALAGAGISTASAMPVDDAPQAPSAHDLRGPNREVDAPSAARPAPAQVEVVRPAHTLGELRHHEAEGTPLG